MFKNIHPNVSRSEDAQLASRTERMEIDGIDEALRLSPARFQMSCMGPDMPREVGTESDSRVPTFIPDDWQKKYVGSV